MLINLTFILYFILLMNRINELSLYLSTNRKMKSKINDESDHSTIALYIIMVYHDFIVMK